MFNDTDDGQTQYCPMCEEIRELCISHEKAEKIVMANEIITKINEVLK